MQKTHQFQYNTTYKPKKDIKKHLKKPDRLAASTMWQLRLSTLWTGADSVYLPGFSRSFSGVEMPLEAS